MAPQCHQIALLGVVCSWAVAAWRRVPSSFLCFLVFFLPQTKQLKGCFHRHIFFALWVRWYTVKTVQNQEVLHGRCHLKLNETFSHGTWTPIRQRKQTAYETLLREWREGERKKHSNISYNKWCHLLWPNNSISNLSGHGKMGFSFSDDCRRSLPRWWNDINQSPAFIYPHSISKFNISACFSTSVLASLYQRSECCH